MKKGDIILFDYDNLITGKWKLLNKLVKKFDGDINHAALYYGGGYVIESWDGIGVRKRKLWKQEKYEAYRVKNIVVDKEIEEYFEETKGMRYSWKDWINTGITKVIHKITGRYVKILKNDKKGFICSEYVNNFFIVSYNIDLCDFTKLESPNDLKKSNKIEKV